MIKICPQCRQQFKTYYRNAIYCGKACHNASMVRAKTYTCAHCGNDFQRPNYTIKRDAERRFCSHDCHTAWKQVNRRQATCDVCGVVFNAIHDGQRACSLNCANVLKTTAVELTCDTCGKQFRSFASQAKNGRRFCSTECARDGMVGPDHPNYRGGKWMKHGRRWQQVRRIVIERDRVCRMCGVERSKSGRALDVHHITPRRAYLITDVSNEIDNLVALCASCHMKVEGAITHGRTSELPRWLRPRE